MAASSRAGALGQLLLGEAERAGVRYQAISNFETGWRSISSSRVSTALKLARALDCTIEDLL